MSHAVPAPASAPGRAVARRLASASLFPLLVTVLGVWSVVGSGIDLARAVGLPNWTNEGLLVALTMGVGFVVIAALERVLPFREDWRRARGDVGTDLTHFLLTGAIANALLRATLLGVYAAGGAWLAGLLGDGPWPGHWPLWLQLVLALLLADLGHYGFHRLSHEWPPLWRLHATHHSPARLYWFNASRFHPLDLFGLLALESAPLVLLGIEPRVLLAFLLFRSVFGQIQHCNVDLATSPLLDRILSSHVLHRWHHSPDPTEGNTNYGAVLSCWDVLFGTWFRPRERRFDGEVGLSGLRAFPSGYWAQLASPFRWRRLEAAAGEAAAEVRSAAR